MRVPFTIVPLFTTPAGNELAAPKAALYIILLLKSSAVLVTSVEFVPDSAIPSALNNAQMFFFSDIEKNQITPTSGKILKYLARKGENGMVSHERLSSVFKNAKDLDDAIETLHRRELIENVNGGYKFQVELIRRWFENR